MPDYILAHDLGTSGDKAALFRTDGRMVGSLIYPYRVYFDEPLWAEQSAEDWWQAVCLSTKDLLKNCRIKPEEVRAVSFSGQMMGCLSVDRSGKPLRRAIIWADQRSQKQSGQIREKVDDRRFYSIAGHPNTASYGIQKAMWIKENQPEIYDRTCKFLNAKDYIVFRLTGKFRTDCSDANSMGCFDLASRNWSEEIIAASGVNPEKLPEVVESITCIGNVKESAAAEIGLSTETKVIMGAGDGVAANVGAGSVEPGKIYCCVGTSAWVAGTTETPKLDEKRRIVCWAHAVPGLYSPNATMQFAGGSYKWMKETLCPDEIRRAEQRGCSPYDVINEEIGTSRPGAEGVIFLPYLLGERAPRWNPNAKGVFYGITPSTTRSQMLRSVMEGIIMNLGVCFDILTGQKQSEEILLIGGAARSSEWQRAIASVYGTRVLVPSLLEEANTIGAAVIAGVGAGLFPDFSVVNRFIEVKTRTDPDPDAQNIYKKLRLQFDLLYEALVPIFDKGAAQK